MPDETKPSEIRLPVLRCPHCNGQLDMTHTVQAEGAPAVSGLRCTNCDRVVTGPELESALACQAPPKPRG